MIHISTLWGRSRYFSHFIDEQKIWKRLRELPKVRHNWGSNAWPSVSKAQILYNYIMPVHITPQGPEQTGYHCKGPQSPYQLHESAKCHSVVQSSAAGSPSSSHNILVGIVGLDSLCSLLKWFVDLAPTTRGLWNEAASFIFMLIL